MDGRGGANNAAAKRSAFFLRHFHALLADHASQSARFLYSVSFVIVTPRLLHLPIPASFRPFGTNDDRDAPLGPLSRAPPPHLRTRGLGRS